MYSVGSSCLPVLTGPVWVLLSYVLNTFISGSGVNEERNATVAWQPTNQPTTDHGGSRQELPGIYVQQNRVFIRENHSSSQFARTLNKTAAAKYPVRVLGGGGPPTESCLRVPLNNRTLRKINILAVRHFIFPMIVSFYVF